MHYPLIDVIIPAFDEEKSIPHVLREIPAHIVREVIVVDNASADNTADIAKRAGATVLHEERKGYGYACLKGIAHCRDKSIPPDVMVFMDGDYSDYPEEMEKILQPILSGNADLVIGSRRLGKKEKGSLTPQQIVGNALATFLIRLFYGVRYTDLGPFRAIRFTSLLTLDMQDKTYGWTVEMQLKAAQQQLYITEVPVNYRKRIGTSKVSGTVKGTILAGYKIIFTIFKYLFR